MEDRTGQPESLASIAEAQRAVRNALVKHIAQVPPELAVNLAVILRCLQELAEIRTLEMAGLPR